MTVEYVTAQYNTTHYVTIQDCIVQHRNVRGSTWQYSMLQHRVLQNSIYRTVRDSNVNIKIEVLRRDNIFQSGEMGIRIEETRKEYDKRRGGKGKVRERETKY